MTPIRVVAPEDIDVLFNPENEDRQGALAKSNYVLVDAHEWRYGVDDSPLCKRGWVTQERALSVRTVHFGNQQLFWECSRMRRSEVHPRGFVPGILFRAPKDILFLSGEYEKRHTKKLIGIRDETRKKRRVEQERTKSQRKLRLTERNPRIEDPNDHNSLVSPTAERKPLAIQGITGVQIVWSVVIETFSGCKLSYSEEILVVLLVWRD